MTSRFFRIPTLVAQGVALILSAELGAQTPPASPPRTNPTENSVNLLGIPGGAVDVRGGSYVDTAGRPISPNAPPSSDAPPLTAAAAKRHFANLVRTQPNSPEAWTGLARCHNTDGEIAEALAAYERLAQLAPHTANLHTWLAELQIAKNDWAAARRSAEKEIAAQPQSGWALSWLGSVDYETGRAAEALAAFQRAAALDPNAASYRYQNGVALGAANQPRRALVDFIAAALMNPRFAAAYFGMADCYAKLGDPLTAIRYYERFVALDAASEWAAKARAEVARLQAGRL